MTMTIAGKIVGPVCKGLANGMVAPSGSGDTNTIVFPLTADFNSTTGGKVATFTRDSGTGYSVDGQTLVTRTGSTARFTSNGIDIRADKVFNRATDYRDFSTGTWAKTNGTVDSDSVDCMDGTTRTTNTFTASSANATLIHSGYTHAGTSWGLSFFIKRKTGTGTVELTLDGGTTWDAVTVTSDWTVVFISITGHANPEMGLRLVTSGDAVYLDWAHLTTGTNCQAVYAVGNTGSNPREFLKIAEPIITDTSNFYVMATITIPYEYLDNDGRFFGGDGLSAMTAYFAATSDSNGRAIATCGSAAAVSAVGSINPGETKKVAVGRDGTNAIISIDGVSETTASTDPTGTLTGWNLIGSANNGFGGISCQMKDLTFYLGGDVTEAMMNAATA